MQIIIKNMAIKAILGILESERKKTQKIIINIKLKYTYNNNNLIDYAKVQKSVKLNLKRNKYFLIEDALNSLLLLLKERFPQIQKINIEILKPNIIKNSQVGAKIKRNFKKI